MLIMVSHASQDATVVGRRLRRRVLLALCLSGLLPVLVLAYAVLRYLFADVGSLRGVHLIGLQGLVFFTLLAMVGGAWIIWDIGRAVSRMGELLSPQPNATAPGARTDEVGALMKSFTGMLTTIEAQAVEINTFAPGLDPAYKELEVTNAKLQETSFRDDVTGLYNRRFFSLRLEEEISRFRRFNHPVSVVLLDLDGFKSINDEFGHAVGDETLREIAQILMKQSRGINVVSRYGGDEFAVLLVETSKSGARLYADRIRQGVATLPHSHRKRVTPSLRVARPPDDEAPTSGGPVPPPDGALYPPERAGQNP